MIADVFLSDPIAAGADATEVDAKFAGQAANGGTGGGRRLAVACFAFGLRLLGRLGRCVVRFDDDGGRFGRRGDLGCRLRGGLLRRLRFLRFFLQVGDRFVELFFLDDVFFLRSGLRLLFLLLGGLGRFLLRFARAVLSAVGFDLEDGAADRDRVALGDEDLHDLAGLRAGDRHGGLVGFEFEEVLVLRDGVAFAHEDRQHVARFNVLAKRGKCDLRGT